MTDLAGPAKEESQSIIRLRRDFHRHPELPFEEKRTSQVVRDYLAGLGLQITCPENMTGLWADLDGTEGKGRILFRADMDALAMTETETERNREYISCNPGVAHCCGHDAHLAMLLTAAKLLAHRRPTPRHNIRFLFQHAEELAPGGAKELIDAGCLEGVDEVYGIHVFPTIPTGRFALHTGPTMAASDSFTISVNGKGGHAAMPHLVRDPVVATGQVITALQQIVSRRTSPFESLVLSISTLRGGSGTFNVIPDTVELLGTTRTLNSDLWKKIPAMIEESASHSAQACNCNATIDYNRGYPILLNAPEAVERARTTLTGCFGQEALLANTPPLMASEDFAYYAQDRPSAYIFMGVGSEEKGITAPNHATDFDIDEEGLYRGTAWFLGLAT